MMQKRLAIITSHPVQYNAPLFKLLNERGNFTIRVFYTWSQSKEKVFDKEFGLALKWDVPLLKGYDYTFVENTASSPGSHHFKGIVNPTLNKEIEEWKADAVLVYGWAFLSHFAAIRYFHGKIPVLFRGDSTLLDEPEGFSFKKLIRRTFLRWLYAQVDYAIYVGTANQNYFLAHGMKAHQLLFAPHAIDNNRFSKDDNKYDQKAKSWRKTLGIPEGDVVFLFAAKLIEKKDPRLLINAFLALSNPHAWLVMVGNGALENELKEKYKNNPSIIFIDFQNQSMMPVVYRLGNIFVLPSKGPGETWGLAVNEAMACGRAVIASDKCGCSSDLIVAGKNGYIFENGKLESLKSCMNMTLQNFKELGMYSKQIIKEWDYSKTADQLNRVFEKTNL